MLDNHYPRRNHDNLAMHIKRLILLIMLLSLTSCSQGSPNELAPSLFTTPTSEKPTATLEPNVTPSSTPVPPGTETNPISLGVIYTDNVNQPPAAAELIQYLADTTGYVFAITNYSSAADLLTAMDQGYVSFTWLQPEEYLYASENDIAKVEFLTSHYGLYGYGSNVYVRADSEFEFDYDPNTGLATSTASAALRQFAQKTPCLVNQRSLSGYAYPLGDFAELNIIINDPVIVQTHESVIRAIYTGGICDFGVTYGISGDPRTASTIQTEFPDVMDKVKIAWQSPADIPSLNMSYATLLSGDIRFAITSALTEFAETPEGLDTLSRMNNYSINGLRLATDDDYDALRTIVKASNVDLETLISQ